ncbi:ABC transporter substrate-binding protein [Streptomyces sp. NPDC050560]|uniref:ABC transporter substrate-binding protein n=1 Tax=Streptomyces sp. NPDC050560 TaxID=3365630 RepID=UPI0037B8F9AD
MTGLHSKRASSRPAPPARRRTGPRAALALAACTALTAGCGVLSGGPDDAHSTVTVMTWAPEGTKATNKPGVPAMAQAYARWANDHGGIDGHRLKVLTCNDHNQSDGAAACAQRAVDEKVVAVVGSYSQYSRAFLSPLENAGIPYIGGYGLTDEEYTSPLSYPVNGGLAALVAGNGRQLAKTCGPVALVRPDTTAGQDLPRLLDSGLDAEGHGPATDLRAPEDASEYTAQSAEALKTATEEGTGDGCVSVSLGDRNDTFFDSFRRTRNQFDKVKVASVFGSVDQSAVDRTGGANSPYEGAYVTGWYPVIGDARWKPMRDVVNEYAFGDNRIDTADAGVQTTWIAYTVLREAIGSLGKDEVTPEALRHSFDNGLRVGTGGLTPRLGWRFEDLIAAKGFPRLVNADVTYQVVRDGRLVPVHKGFVNMEKTLEDAF